MRKWKIGALSMLLTASAWAQTPTQVDGGTLRMATVEADRSLDDRKQAIAMYTAQIRSNPDQLDAWLSRSEERAALGDEDGAIRDIRQIITRFPQRPEGYAFLGEAYLDRDLYREGWKFTSQAIEKDPEYAPAYYQRARARLALGDTRLACVDWSRAADLGYMEAYDKISANCRIH